MQKPGSFLPGFGIFTFFDMVKANMANVSYDCRIVFLAIQILSIYVLDTVKGVIRTYTRIQTENKPNI